MPLVRANVTLDEMTRRGEGTYRKDKALRQDGRGGESRLSWAEHDILEERRLRGKGGRFLTEDSVQKGKSRPPLEGIQTM